MGDELTTTAEAKTKPVAETDAGSSGAPTLATLVTLAWPIVVARSSQAIVGFCDALMVARLGSTALAATTTGSFNTYFLLMLPMGTCFVVSSFTSQLFGRRDLKAARRYGWYGLAIALLSGIIVAMGTPFVSNVLEQLRLEDDVVVLMTSYMSIRLLSATSAVGLEALGNYYGGMGNTKLPMLAQLVAMVLNVFINWLLIFGNWGAPALGVAGAAWASLIATTIAFLLLFGAFLMRLGVPSLSPEPSSLAAESPVDTSVNIETIGTAKEQGNKGEDNKEEDAARNERATRWFEFFQLLRFGIPAGLNWFLEMGAFIFFLNVVVAGMGTVGLAAMNAVIQLNSIAFMPAFGIASAGAILVGQALGRSQLSHAKRSTTLALICACSWQSAVGLMYLLFPALLIGLFVDDREANAEFLRVGGRMLMLSSAWQLFDAIANTMAESLRAAGDTTFTLWARVFVAWFIFVPLSLAWVTYGDGAEGAAVICMVVYMSSLAVVLSLRYRSGAWQKISLFR